MGSLIAWLAPRGRGPTLRRADDTSKFKQIQLATKPIQLATFPSWEEQQKHAADKPVADQEVGEWGASRARLLGHDDNDDDFDGELLGSKPSSMSSTTTTLQDGLPLCAVAAAHVRGAGGRRCGRRCAHLTRVGS